MRPLPRDEARLITLREERPTSSLERVRAIRHAIIDNERELIWAHYRLNSWRRRTNHFVRGFPVCDYIGLVSARILHNRSRARV